MIETKYISNSPDTASQAVSNTVQGTNHNLNPEVDQSLTINRFVTIALRSYDLGLSLTNDEITNYEEHMLTIMNKKGLVIIEEIF